MFGAHTSSSWSYLVIQSLDSYRDDCGTWAGVKRWWSKIWELKSLPEESVHSKKSKEEAVREANEEQREFRKRGQKGEQRDVA